MLKHMTRHLSVQFKYFLIHIAERLPEAYNGTSEGLPDLGDRGDGAASSHVRQKGKIWLVIACWICHFWFSPLLHGYCCTRSPSVVYP